MTRIAMITAAFPYPPGEQFIEEEIRYWAAVPALELVLMPLVARGEPREIPSRIQLDLRLAQGCAAAHLWRFLLRALFHSVFWREVASVLRRKGFSAWCLAKAWHATAQMLRVSQVLQACLAGQKFDLVYCYWNDSASLGAALQKRLGTIPRLVTRIHNYELYEEEAPHHYIPLKRQFVADIDRFYAVSRQGQAYLKRVYGVPANKATLSRLGVPVPEQMATTSSGNALYVLSISFCVPHKRVDLIIEALARLSEKLPEMDIYWTHLGAGPLHESLKDQAASAFLWRNVHWSMPGHLSNAGVKLYLESQPVDLLLNASKNEGVPVSVMEAMSYGVPAVAPDVGGVAELVSAECGCLMHHAPSAQELAEAIAALLPRLKLPGLRVAARDKICADFHAGRNYARFILRVLRDTARLPARENLPGGRLVQSRKMAS